MREESGRTSIESDQRVSAYFEAALDCVIMADASGRVVEFNPAAERTFGYSRDEALGRTMAELIVPPSLRERHSTAFARFIETRHRTLPCADAKPLNVCKAAPRKGAVSPGASPLLREPSARRDQK